MIAAELLDGLRWADLLRRDVGSRNGVVNAVEVVRPPGKLGRRQEEDIAIMCGSEHICRGERGALKVVEVRGVLIDGHVRCRSVNGGRRRLGRKLPQET